MAKQRIELQTALRDNETFLKFLTQETQSEKYGRFRERAGTTPHPSGEKLYDYVLGWLDDQEAGQVRAHLALCSDCTHEVMRIMHTEDELEQESLDRADIPLSSSEEEEISLPISEKVSLFERLVKWISPLWEPQWAGQFVTAMDIPQQTHTFTSEDGDIQISCYWKGQYQNEPAYIQITWKASLITEDEIWIRFINPATQAVRCEVCLGTNLVGDETFTHDDLGFDPSYERWAIAVVLQEALET